MNLTQHTVIAVRERHERSPVFGAFAYWDDNAWHIHSAEGAAVVAHPVNVQEERGRLMIEGMDDPVQIVSGLDEGIALWHGHLAYPGIRKGAYVVKAQGKPDILWSDAHPHPDLGSLLDERPGLLIGEGGCVAKRHIDARLTLTQYPNTQCFVKTTQILHGDVVSGQVLGNLEMDTLEQGGMAFCPNNRPGRPLVALWPGQGPLVLGLHRTLSEIDRSVRLEQELQGMGQLAAAARIPNNEVPGYVDRYNEWLGIQPSLSRAKPEWSLSTDSEVLRMHFKSPGSGPSRSQPSGTPGTATSASATAGLR